MLRFKSRNKEYVFDQPVVMGILNVTPDSFSDGGKFNEIDTALAHCETMLNEGAAIIDIGGCSTRSNNAIATESEELDRVIPVVKTIRKHFPEAVLSVDTFRKSIAEACISEGADIVNDISGGLFDDEMLPFIGKNHIPYVMMHCVGTPETMHQYKLNGNIHQTVMDFFRNQHKKLEASTSHVIPSEERAKGIYDQQIILDPGIGFGKTIDSNFALLSNLEEYRFNGYPILIGISRKSFIFKTLGCTPQEADNGTTVANTIALLNGADIIRVHDVKKAIEAITLTSHL